MNAGVAAPSACLRETRKPGPDRQPPAVLGKPATENLRVSGHLRTRADQRHFALEHLERGHQENHGNPERQRDRNQRDIQRALRGIPEQSRARTLGIDCQIFQRCSVAGHGGFLWDSLIGCSHAGYRFTKKLLRPRAEFTRLAGLELRSKRQRPRTFWLAARFQLKNEELATSLR